jgi:sporulation protein YlmC with PRC-barrel domain
MNRIRPLILANSLHGFSLHAKDGPIGKIDDFYFSDQEWKIRHVGIAIDHLFDMRKVLVSPSILGSAEWRKKHIAVDATREQISGSPDAGMALPAALQIDPRANTIARQGMHWPEAYWSAPARVLSAKDLDDERVDAHLRSARILQGAEIDNEDGTLLGHIADLLIDTHSWEIPFLMIKALDGRIFITNPEIVKNIDTSRRSAVADIVHNKNDDWLEYNPHYMALMSITE